jgi:mono/diheme cytochrome c family protein
MYSETAAQLVAHFEHPSGWWRDTAQKLLVLRQDKSVVPALTAMARANTNVLARIHALWTLEGLDALDAAVVRELMKSPDARIRIQAIRASESLYKRNDKSFAADYRAMTEDGDPNVAIQAMLTLNLHKVPGYETLVQAAVANTSSRGVREIGTQILRPRTSMGQRPSLADTAVTALNLSTDDRRALQRGEATYKELCTTCHGADGRGAPMAGMPEGTTLAPALAESPRVAGHRDSMIAVLLHGLTGPVAGKDYPGGVMVAMGANTDQWIADITNYVRNSFGNAAGTFVTPGQVAAARARYASRKTPWTATDLDAALPRLLTNQSEWTLSASHNPEAAPNVLAGSPFARWDTAGPQQPGMWFQIELPQPVRISEIQIDTSVPFTMAALGGRGRGAAQAPGRGAPPAPGRAGPGERGGRGTAPAAGRGRGGGRGGPVIGPIGYSVQFSMDGRSWSTPVAEGPGATPTTVMTMTPADARFVRITQTGKAAGPEGWAIAQVRIYEAPR